MTIERVPALLLGIIMCAYWGCVVVMVVKVSRRTRKVQRVLVPAQRREQLMWAVWVPLVLAWITLPLVAALVADSGLWFALPAQATASGVFLAVRFAAAGLAVAALLLSIWCWRHMGRHWRMAIDPQQEAKLVQDGPFALVRHPIYALSIGLMLCTVVAVPTLTMILVAAAHITLMQLKARTEEVFLQERFGAAYTEYCGRTKRFVPRSWRAMAAVWNGAASSGNARLTFYQRAMLLWERIHPYNAAHIVRLPGPADAQALRAAATDVCRAAGIGELVVQAWRGTYGYRPLREIPIRVFPPTAEPDWLLRRVIADAMNAPFPCRPHHPMRWILFDESDGAAHYIVLVYHHVVSDAQGIELLLGAVLCRYLNPGGPYNDAPLVTRVPRCTTWINGALRRRGYLHTFRRLLKLDLDLRCSHKMPDDRHGGDETEMVLRTAPRGLHKSLSAACRDRHVGLNDVFSAALVAALAERTTDRHTSRRRHNIALGFMLNGRRNSPEDVTRYFGMCLADTILIVDNPDADLDGLVTQVAAQTRPWKADFDAVAAVSALRVFFIRHVRRALFIPNRRRSYRRLFPMCAGVTTVVVDAERLGVGSGISRYIRACPPGPAAPMALAPTILRDRLELSLVYRPSCLNADAAESLLDGVLAKLAKWAGAAGSKPGGVAVGRNAGDGDLTPAPESAGGGQ